MGVVTSIGTNIDTGLTNSCVVTLTAPVAIGDTVLVAAGSSITAQTVTVTDSRGNIYATDKNQNGAGSSSFSIARAPVTVALIAGDTVTVTYSGVNTSNNAKLVIVGSHAGTLTIDKSAGALGSSTSWSSGATVSTTQADEVCFGGSMDNASTDGSSTGTSGYTNVASINDASVGALGFNLTAVYKTVAAVGAQTATGTWSGTGASQDTKSAIVTYKLPVTASSSVAPVRIPNRNVGPMALRQRFRRPTTATTAVAATTTFNDSGTGTITLSGTGTESQSHTASGAGTITLSGSRTESQTHSGSGTGTITLSGTGTESQTHTSARSGTVTLSGSRTESQSHTVAGTGTVTLSGSGFDDYIPPGPPGASSADSDRTPVFLVTHH